MTLAAPKNIFNNDPSHRCHYEKDKSGNYGAVSDPRLYRFKATDNRAALSTANGVKLCRSKHTTVINNRNVSDKRTVLKGGLQLCINQADTVGQILL